MTARQIATWTMLALIFFLTALYITIFTAGSLRAETGIASHYGYESGRVRADGFPFRPSEIGAATTWVPLCRKRAKLAGRCRTPILRVTVLSTGRSLLVPANDWGPHKRLHRLIDLSDGAARALGVRGLAKVHVQVVHH